MVLNAPHELSEWFSGINQRALSLRIEAKLKVPQKGQPINKACVTLEYQHLLGSITAWGAGTFEFIIVDGQSREDLVSRNLVFATSQELWSFLEGSFTDFVSRVHINHK
jgi:hypothetical protein